MTEIVDDKFLVFYRVPGTSVHLRVMKKVDPLVFVVILNSFLYKLLTLLSLNKPKTSLALTLSKSDFVFLSFVSFNNINRIKWQSSNDETTF